MTATSAEQSLREGQLDQALAQLQEQVRRNPAEAKYRVFLFQLLAVMGQWERALTQLAVCGELDAANLAMVQTYREAIRCEAWRNKVFQGELSPVVFGKPEQWMALLAEAAKLCASGAYAQAGELRDQAFEQAPATSGTLNGQAFEWIADADTRLGPMVEAIVNGRYYWIPFCRIAKLTLEEPSDLRDLVWTPAQFTWTNGGGSVGLIPSRYPDSDRLDDPGIRLGRKTEWQEPAAGHYLGLGQRVFATGESEHPLFGIRELLLNSEPPAEHG